MKILFLSYNYWPPEFGGGLLHTIERLESLSLRGNQISVLTSGAEGFDSLESKAGFIIHRSRYSKRGNIFEKGIHRLLFFLWALIQLVKREYDIVHIGTLPGINQLSSALCGLLFLLIIHVKKAKAVYLYALAESECKVIIIKGLSGHLISFFYRNLDVVVVNSTGLCDGMEAIFGSKIKMILNGVKDEAFSPDRHLRDCVRKEYSVNDEIVYTFVGSIEKRKGVDMLLDAFELINQNDSNAKLWLIGPSDKQGNQNIDDVESNLLLKKAATLPNVTYWGRINERAELNRLLNASDIFVFPTRREGMPMAPLQAMACGLPVIISKIPGITDLAIIDQVSGLFIPVGDVEDLRSAMQELADDRKLRIRMGKAARQCILDEFGWENHINDWENLYSSLRGRRI